MFALISVKIDQVVDDVKSQCRIRASCFLVFIQRPSKHLRIGNSGTHQLSHLLVRLLTSLLAPKHASKHASCDAFEHTSFRSMAYSIVCSIHVLPSSLSNTLHTSKYASVGRITHVKQCFKQCSLHGSLPNTLHGSLHGSLHDSLLSTLHSQQFV